MQAFAEALLIIVKVLAQNSGLDPQEAIVKLQQEYIGTDQAVGLDIKTGNNFYFIVICNNSRSNVSYLCVMYNHLGLCVGILVMTLTSLSVMGGT